MRLLTKFENRWNIFATVYHGKWTLAKYFNNHLSLETVMLHFAMECLIKRQTNSRWKENSISFQCFPTTMPFIFWLCYLGRHWERTFHLFKVEIDTQEPCDDYTKAKWCLIITFHRHWVSREFGKVGKLQAGLSLHSITLSLLFVVLYSIWIRFRYCLSLHNPLN